MTSVEPAVTVCFSVNIGGQDLGTFMSCEGLGIEVVLEQREEGGFNGQVWQLPTRLKYSNIKLSRPLGPQTQSTQVAQWFASMVTGVKRRTATIVARNAKDEPVATWNLAGVVPVRWTGPSLNVESPKIATETIEIAHHGFLPA
jgi:phage tail-like protein